MIKRRISLLQKWILLSVYTSERGRIHRHEILEIYFGCVSRGSRKTYDSWRNYGHDKNMADQAHIARIGIVNSLKNLKAKGWVEMVYHNYRERWVYMKKDLLGNYVTLTELGKFKAIEILNKKE